MRLAPDQRHDRSALHLVRHRNPGGIQQRRGQIHQAHQFPQLAASLEPRAGEDGWHANRGFVAGALVLTVAGLEVATMVGREQHDRVVQQVETLQRVEQTSVGFVEPLDHPPVPRQVLLRRPTEGQQVGRGPAPFVTWSVANRSRVVIDPVLVMGFQIRTEQEERLLAMVGDVADCRVGLCVHPVAWECHFFFIVVENREPVWLRGEFEGVGSKPGLVAAAFTRWHRVAIRQVPLANVAGVIPRIVEPVGEGALSLREGNAVSEATGGGWIQAGLQARAGWAADGLARERVVDMRALARNPVEVRRQVERVAMQSHRVPALLVGKEDDHVWRAAHARTSLLETS